MTRLSVSLEETKMNWHKVGKNIRRATGGLSSKIFGAMKTTESPHLKVPKGTELVGNVTRHEQTEKNLRELEFTRTRSFDVVRRIQNR